MASPFQQQVRQRKILYIGLIIVLLTTSWIWRKWVIDELARPLAIRDYARGEVELTGAVVRLALTGSRGVATCILWDSAIRKQKKNQWNELEVLVRSLTKLQPHFITPWLFQSWNLAYNVSVESDRVRDKYFYITRGIELLAEGERQNAYHPDLRWSIGFYTMHKINKSDETNYKRSLFQLTLIPPNERDPARFQKLVGEDLEFNWEEFEDFCAKHPQLVRRLKEGMFKESAKERKKQFVCERASDIVRFLEDNFNVPSIYIEDPQRSQVWNPAKKDIPLDPKKRFPPLPPRGRPEGERPFDESALTEESPLGDDIDAYAVAHSWFCYSQEPLPPPDEFLPGNSQPITNPAKQRRPKHMTTLLFRNYPAQGARYMAERLQEEYWYDGEGWNARELFQEWPGSTGKEYVYGKDRAWSREAWTRAAAAWRDTGERNRLLFRDAAEEQNMRENGARFASKYNLGANGAPPVLRDEDLPTQQDRDEYNAARFMFEYEFYRNLSNFPYHYHRALVEMRDETIVCRKRFAQAELLQLGSPIQAIELYSKPRLEPNIDVWSEKPMSTLEAWRDLVLLKHKEFRRDNLNQEQTAEYEIRYLDLFDRLEGGSIRRNLVRMFEVLPMIPPASKDRFKASLINGPLNVNDDEGVPLISSMFRDTVLERMGLMVRPSVAPPEGARPGGPTQPPGMSMPRGE